MKLPFSFLQKKSEEESEYYLALLLTDEKASAVILHESLGQLKIIGKNEELFSTNLETASAEELISLVDKTVSKAEEILPSNIETHKTVFGVKESWVEADTKKIKKEYLAKLKKVCDELDLTPIGFMVVTEAISHLLQEEEGAPLSAILAEVGHQKVMLTLFRGGKPAEKIDGPLTDSAPETVDTLLKHFTTAVLPARIILYDGKNAEKLSQSFIGHTWSKSLPFLHVPQITVLPQGFDGKAVAFGAAAQMGFELLGLELKETQHNENESKHEPKEESKEEEIIEEKHTKHESSHISSDNFGFIMDHDIQNTPAAKEFEEKIQSEERTDYGEEHHNLQNIDTKHFQVGSNHEESIESIEKPNMFAFLKNIKLPKLPLPAFLSGRKNPLALPLIVLAAIILIGGAFTYYYFNSMQAHIILTVKPKMVDQTSDVIFSGTSSSDFSKNIIAAKAVSTTVDGSLSIDTTGKKDVGNKAKGTVTVYNNGDSSVSLDSGTQIKSSNGLTFSLDKNISIASASGDVFSGTKPGTTDIAVTASVIGTESNLPSGTKFSIGSNSNLAAKNDSAFSGGTKKQVQVVSKNDIAKLKTELPKSLESKAKDAISQKADGNMTLLPLLSVVNLNKPKFDNNVDDEAKTIKLTASVEFEALTYENSELNNFAKSLLKDKYSQDISDQSIKNDIQDLKEGKDQQVEAKLTIEAGLLPDINTQDVISKVEKMSPGKAKEFLSGLPQIASNEITFSPAIPLLPNLFPRLPNHVSIELKPE